ncbi:MAG: 5-amino-6-(D-ribitylamino)uracil--L-tyrosine 4-hydroxyphenyl transferase CofH [Promethearchaeota archaeon]
MPFHRSKVIQIPSVPSRMLKIVEKSRESHLINRDELLYLFSLKKPAEILLLIETANNVREMLKGNQASFVINRNINFTNVCSRNCHFCEFSVPSSHPTAFLLSFNEIEEKLNETLEMNATEVCIQGGINPKVDFEYYLQILDTVRSVAPNLHIHAFSPEEIRYMVQQSQLPLTEVLTVLKREGLGSMPGTAAEILVEDIRKQICPRKLSVNEWTHIITTAHKLRIPTSATMMYGHIETPQDIVDHLITIKEIQRNTRSFTEFVPLSFIHQKTALYRKYNARPGASGLEDIKVHAIARLFFGDILPNIQASWVKLGFKLAQFMLCAGVNDLGGTIYEENISRAARGEKGEVYASPEQLATLIKECGFIPHQRDTLYSHFVEWSN